MPALDTTESVDSLTSSFGGLLCIVLTDAVDLLSVPTLMLSTGIVGLSVAIVLGLLARRHRGESSFLPWTAGIGLHTLGLVFLGASDTWGSVHSLTAGNLLVAVAFLGYVPGAARLSGSRVPWRILVGSTLVAAAAIVVFTYVRYDQTLRVGMIGLHSAVGQGLMITYLVRAQRTDRSMAAAALLGMVVLGTVSFAVRSVLVTFADADVFGGAANVLFFSTNLVFFSTGGLLFLAVLEDRARSSLTKASAELERLARLDSLSGLANRRHFDLVFADELARATRYERPLSLVMIDIDHFKRVNDDYGHLVGDDVIRRVAATVRDQLRASDTAARYGGEELVVLLPETAGTAARDVAERIRMRVADLTLSADERSFSITVSSGVATSRPGDDAATLTARADAALYEAKRAGRDRVAVESRGPSPAGTPGASEDGTSLP